MLLFYDISLQSNPRFQNVYTQDWMFPRSASPIWNQTVAFKSNISIYTILMTMGIL